MQIAIVLGLLVIAIVLFAMEKLSVDIITLLLLMGLVLTGILRPREAFEGFSEDIIIILASIFVISGALQRSGIMDALGAKLQLLARGSKSRLTFIVMVIVGAISSFMNNTTATAIFVPPVIGMAKQSKISASKLLMPLAFASIMGGTCTLIGTSTNVAVSGYIARNGMEPVGLFEITPIGIVIVLTGIAYMMLIGQRLLPDHKNEGLIEEYAMREYLSEIVVMPDSHLTGQRIFESDLSKMDFRVLEVLRGQQRLLPTSRTRIEAGDILLVEGKVSDLIKVKETAGIEIKAEAKLSDLESDEIKIVEAMITPQSDLIDSTLKESNFRARFGVVTLAINRHGHPLREKLGRIRLRMGDLLLIQGPADRVDDLRRNRDLWVIEELSPVLFKGRKGLYTLAFFISAIALGGFGLVPLSIAFLGAAVLTILFRCITAEEAYESIDWRLIILIGGMTAFGTAMDDKHTGAAQFLASLIVASLQPYGVIVILGGFFLITMVLTQPMSNAAAALVVLPVALETARSLGADERTFAIAIMLAASVSFVTPFEPSCILVYGPGKYKFMDFVKVGFLLTLLLMAIIMLILPLLWPLYK